MSSKDSLAGVALKYGITMSELRKANQLWASDSIHLRKVLYIPLDSKKKRNNQKPLIDLEPASGTSSEQDLIGDKPTSSTIRRIPASQLSFFPPSTKPPLPMMMMDPEDSSYNNHPYSSTLPSRRAGLGTNSPGQPSRALASILTSFPMAASTRDTIVSRLSFDSERSSVADDQEHELDEVRSSMMTVRPRLRSTSSKSNDAPSHPSRLRDNARVTSPQQRVSTPDSSAIPDHRKSWTHTDTSRSRAAVRTVQPDPLPAMIVPSLNLKPKSRPEELFGSEADQQGSRR